MKSKSILKITVDVAMTASLLLLMAYELVGRVAHEWIGMEMFALFIIHHILNVGWSRNLFKGKYTTYRIFQTIIVIAVFLCMIGLMVSGIMLSRYVFRFLNISVSRSFTRILHMLCSYWGFTLMSLHLGLHWNMMMGMARGITKHSSLARKVVLRCMAALIAGYGIYAFIKRGIGSYMLLQTQFVFFDYEEPLILFFFDYLTVMGLFACIGHYLAMLLRKRMGRN